MTRNLLAMMIAAAAIPLHAAPDPIGVIKDLKGKWCRDGRELGKVPVYLIDQITYCGGSVPAPPSQGIHLSLGFDSITIEFHPQGKPQFNQTYDCSMPDICGNKRPPLWLVGAYLYHDLRPLRGAPTISVPTAWLLTPPPGQTSIPDQVLAETSLGITIPSYVFSGKGSTPIEICSITPRLTCLHDFPTPSSPTFNARPGLHSVYMRTGDNPHSLDTSPDGLFLVVGAKSKAVQDWLKVPEAFRMSTNPTVVQERRNYLLDLYSHTKQ
jgi:hypothetical protein